MDIESALSSIGTTISTTLNSTLILPKEEIDPETCRLLGPVALLVQAIMGVLVIGSLLIKRGREKPRRRWRVWIGDISKQIVGQAFVHASNVLISDLIARHQSDNPCSLYALNIAVDTTLGVLILFIFLKLLTSLLRKSYPESFKTGDYGTPFTLSIWAKQALVYVAALSLMKIVVLILFWLIPGLIEAANWCLSWLKSDEGQVVAVMLVFPLIMNIIQFLIIDSFLKSKPNLSPSSLEDEEGDEESRQGFLEHHEESADEGSDRERLVQGGRGEEESAPPRYSGVVGVSGGGSGGGGSGRSGGVGGTKRGGGEEEMEDHSYPPGERNSGESSSSVGSSSSRLESQPPKSIPIPQFQPKTIPTPQPLPANQPQEEEETRESSEGRSSFEAWGLEEEKTLLASLPSSPIISLRDEKKEKTVRWSTPGLIIL